MKSRKSSNQNSRKSSSQNNVVSRTRVIKKEFEFEPRTENQKKLINEIKKNTVVFATGPAGTGKTLVSVAIAAKMLLNKDVERIVITRPVIEAAEDNLGYLPGDLEEKIDPYLVPLKDSLSKFFGKEIVESLFIDKKIEVVPLAYMRGRSLEDSIIICDESQNATFEGLHMLLTRVGKNSRLIVNGDLSQIDLRPRNRSGLEKVMSALRNIEDIGFVHFHTEDIQRHPVVGAIVKALEKYDKIINENLKNQLGILPKTLEI